MKKLIKYVSVALVFVLNIALFTSCIFKQETLSYSYERLSDGLLKIEYVNVTGEIAIEKEIEVYKTLSEEEQEYVLNRMQDIEFKKQFAVEKPDMSGEALVFCYSAYKLYISPNTIEKEYFNSCDNESGERLLYDIKYNQSFRELIDSIKNNT